jgi:thymidylate kinase
VLDYYANRNFHHIDGNRSPEEIHRLIEQVLTPALTRIAKDRSSS